MYKSQKKQQFFIFLGDFCLGIFAIFCMLFLRYSSRPSNTLFCTHFLYFTPFILINTGLMYILNMYSLKTPFQFQSSILKLFITNCTTAILGLTFFYLYKSSSFSPRLNLILFAFFNLIFLIIWRKSYDVIITKNKHKPQVIFIDCAKSLPTLIQQLQTRSYLNFIPALVVITNKNTQISESEKIVIDKIKKLDVPVTTNIADIEDYTNGNHIFVFSSELSIKSDLQSFFYTEIGNGIPFYQFSKFYELVIRQIPLEDISESWVLENLDLTTKYSYKALKRIGDILFSIIAFTLTLWIWPIIALCIKIGSKGPVFFTQIREGYAGKQFKIYKFRTMTVSHNSFSPTGVNDARITKLGNILRKTRIDEIPQILNVFLGDMSLIGPRPERPELAVELEKHVPFYRQRLIVKPGITGWDQVSGEYHSPSVEDTRKKLQNDLYYIKNFSLSLDSSIISKTIFTVLKRAGR